MSISDNEVCGPDGRVQRSPPILFRGKAYRSPKVFRAGTHRAQDPGETFKAIKPYLERAGVTRIADVTGLDNVGVPTTLAIRPNALTMACSSGKGLSLDQAYVSGAMEAFELHAAETAPLTFIRASYRELSSRYALPAVDDLPLTRSNLFSLDWPFHWFLGWDLISQSEIPVPASVVGMSRDRTLITSIGSFHITSNGLGAGNSFLEAIAAGLYEVVERDAIACRFFASATSGRGLPTLSETTLGSYPLLASVLDRCNRARVKLVVHDSTVDTTVPTYSAIVYDEADRGVGVVKGTGSHLDPEIAILRAITEALQARLNFIAGSRDDIFRTAFVRVRADWGRAVAAIERVQTDCPQAAVRISHATNSFENDINHLLACVQAAGVQQVIVADLTPPDFPVNVVRVLIPGFEGYMHHGYRAGRRALNFARLEVSA